MNAVPATLNEGNYQQLLDLLETCFVDDVREYFDLHQRCDPAYDYSQGQILTADDRIISHVQVFHRKVGYGEDSIPYGGIGDVATHPDWQEQGLSALLLKQAIGYMDTQRLPLSILFTKRVSHYAKHGWHQIPGMVVRADVPEELPPVPGGIAIRDPLEDASGLLELYEDAMAGLVGPDRRTLDYMTGQARWLPLQGEVRCEVYHQLGHPVGYLRTRVERGEIRVMDVCASSEGLGRLAATRALHHAREADCRHIQATFPSRSRLAAAFVEITGVEREPGSHRMMRLNNLRGTLEQLEQTFATRLRDPYPQPPFALTVGEEVVRLEPRPRGIALGEATGNEPVIAIDPKLFLDLLMGQPGSHRRLTAGGGDAGSLAVLQRMFSESGNVSWPADGF